jgi:hypothetical protein
MILFLNQIGRLLFVEYYRALSILPEVTWYVRRIYTSNNNNNNNNNGNKNKKKLAILVQV